MQQWIAEHPAADLSVESLARRASLSPRQSARACGYGTPEAMRRAFIRALGVSPAEYGRRSRPVHLKETHADRHPAL